MWRASVLVGRTLFDLLFAAVFVLVHDRRPHRPRHRLAPDPREPCRCWPSSGVALLFSYALSWGLACLGMISKGPESAMSIGFIVIFPLAFVSNALVPRRATTPSWLRFIADWNPVSAVTAAARTLFGNPNPTGSHAWPMQHPVAAALLWSIAIIAVAAPHAVRLFQERTVE